MKYLLPVCVALVMSFGAANAEMATTPAAPAAKAKAAAPKERTAKSLECSKEADAKGLHGKERQKFRSECKKK
jgi:psiF repeat